MAIAAGLVLPACADEAGPAGGGDADAGDAPEGGGPDGGPAEEQPPPAEGPGHPDPPSRSLHNRCGGVDWQLIHGWLLVPHRAPRMAPPDTIQRCVDRYAGWVSHQADRVGLSRKSIYAALVATGQCEADRGYHGAALLSGAQCAEVHPELGEGECLDRMAASPGFGITTLADYLGSDEALAAHRRDVPLMAAYLASGEVRCGGDGGWKLAAPEGLVTRFIEGYNGVKATVSEPPACKKRLVVTVALYTGMDDPGVDGVAAANGCWTYERVSKSNKEWKLCQYDGGVLHPDGHKWVYDDTNTTHDAATERSRIQACAGGVPGRGYVYMANRGAGWRKSIESGVRVHFAEIYSSQYQVDDQFSLWRSAGEPGEPMIHLGEASTGAARIRDATRRACAEVKDGGFLGVYLYPESLRGDRMSAMVKALNACTRAP